jgi:Na+-transporting NADH:ubiquinone oxidoreductase subunit F
MGTVKIDVNNGRKILETDNSLTLLDALASKNIFLPSACGSSGRCGLCTVKVLNFSPDYSKSELDVLSDSDKEQGLRLACQVKMTQDLQIQIPSEFLSAQEYSAKVTGKKTLTYDIVELTLKLVQPQEISFHAGQYITLKMPAIGDNKAAMRPFSIATSSARKSEIQLNIRLNPQGTLTPWVFNDVKEGDDIKFSGPRGNFYMRNSLNPMLLIAGGSGMAPVRSILQTMRDFNIKREVLFFFGALSQNDLFYIEEMKELESQIGSFKFIPALSNEPSESNWNGERGLVTDVMDTVKKGSMSEYEAYLCGKPAMINGCISLLEKKQILKENIFFDLFNSPKSVK